MFKFTPSASSRENATKAYPIYMIFNVNITDIIYDTSKSFSKSSTSTTLESADIHAFRPF